MGREKIVWEINRELRSKANRKKYTQVPRELIIPWQKFVPLTAQISEQSEEDVELVIEFIFAWFREWVKSDQKKGALILHELGSFELNTPHIYKKLNKMIPYLRGKDREKFIERFDWYWKARIPAKQYQIAKKSTNRRFFPAKEK